MLRHMFFGGGLTMNASESQVRLFRNGRSQALRIPREFEIEGDEAILWKEGHRLVIEPVRKGLLFALLEAWQPIEESFPNVDENIAPLVDTEL